MSRWGFYLRGIQEGRTSFHVFISRLISSAVECMFLTFVRFPMWLFVFFLLICESSLYIYFYKDINIGVRGWCSSLSIPLLILAGV